MCVVICYHDAARPPAEEGRRQWADLPAEPPTPLVEILTKRPVTAGVPQ